MKIWHQEKNRLMSAYIDMEARDLIGIKMRLDDFDEEIPLPN